LVGIRIKERKITSIYAAAFCGGGKAATVAGELVGKIAGVADRGGMLILGVNCVVEMLK